MQPFGLAGLRLAAACWRMTAVFTVSVHMKTLMLMQCPLMNFRGMLTPFIGGVCHFSVTIHTSKMRHTDYPTRTHSALWTGRRL